MKRTLRLLVVLALAGILLTYAGCKHKPDQVVPVTDTQIDAFSKNKWKASVVTRDGGAPETTYGAFTLTFSGTHGAAIPTLNYTADGRPDLSPWPASGTMTFVTATPTTNLIRNDAVGDPVPINYTLTATQLVLTFQYNGAGFPNTRTDHTDAVTGHWSFTMVPD